MYIVHIIPNQDRNLIQTGKSPDYCSKSKFMKKIRPLFLLIITVGVIASSSRPAHSQDLYAIQKSSKGA